ncbi:MULTISPECIES: MerR family transcriptional regulator [Vibrio]|uniref:HTH-type transcriptional regulator CueR n=2 Tax=Vibrio casei TaxID=673372 RepID=A0A368LNQ5_9VIBR|nr:MULTISPECIES: MerR family transcriptional regulator [Vibrio]RCS73441.1 MerR family transcriptional regulator [Vibrio casei]SJN24857.1 Transcriptional regulator, MerR family [Vibrio casei]HBV77397.1 MerR family DNA-binding transcriptional regulator [Vibrio sp.]
MFIGEVSKRTKLSIKAIRLYEEKGLIIKPKRQGTYRIYTEEHVEVLKLISEAKTLGVTLAELKGLIKYQNGAVNWPEINIFLIGIKCRLVADLNEISEKIAKIDTCMKSIDSCPKTP